MRINKVVSTLILVCFLFNTAVSDLAFGLATPSGLNDIVGIQHKDMGRIKLALEEQLVALVHPGLPVNIGTFQTILKEQTVKEKTIFQPADMQFFFHETKLTNAGLCVMCRVNDKYGLRTYYATFSLQKDENDGFPISIYTEEQYKGTAGFTKGTPQIKAEDSKAIERYVNHEKGVDAVIAYAHENGLAKEPSPREFDYKTFVENMLSEAGVTVTNPENLIPIQNRKFYVIKLTKEIQNMIAANPAVVVDAEGKEHAVAYYAHSSNDAMHVFVKEEAFEALTTAPSHAITYQRAVNEVEDKLSYEIGVPLGLPVAVDNAGKLSNELSRRTASVTGYSVSDSKRKELQANPLEVAIVNLDHVKERDYAAGKREEERQAVLSDLYIFLTGKEWGTENRSIEVTDLKAVSSTQVELTGYVRTLARGGNTYQTIRLNAKPNDYVAVLKALREFLNNAEATKQITLSDNKRRLLDDEIATEEQAASVPMVTKPLAQSIDEIARKAERHIRWAIHNSSPQNCMLNLVYWEVNKEGVPVAQVMVDSFGLYKIRPGDDTKEQVAKYLQGILEHLKAPGVISYRFVEGRGSGYVRGELSSAVTLRIEVPIAEAKPKTQVQIQSGGHPATITLTTISPSDLLQTWPATNSRFIGVVDFPTTGHIKKYEYQLFENGKVVRWGTDDKWKSTGSKELQENELPPAIAQIKNLIGQEPNRQWLQINLWAGSRAIVLPTGQAYFLMSPDEHPNDIKVFRPIDLQKDKLFSQLDEQIGQYLSAIGRHNETTPAPTESTAMKLVTLKNGSQEAEGLVVVAMMSLRKLIQEKPIVFYELVMKARDPNHKFFGQSIEDLKALSLVSVDGSMHDSIRNIVLSAAEGEGLDMALTSPIRLVPTSTSTAGQQEIATMIPLASEAGLQIPTHPNERYNLLVTSEFFANGELEEHRAKYGDRFDLDRVSGVSPAQFVDNILAKATGKETKTIALVPNDLPAEQLERLAKVGIRFIRVNITDLQKAKADKDAGREKFQVDTYAMMLLLRRIDNSITADSSIYQLLSFYLKSHFALADKVAIDDYIMAIVNNDVARLIKGCLAYRPAQPYEVPNYNNVAASLISA